MMVDCWKEAGPLVRNSSLEFLRWGVGLFSWAALLSALNSGHIFLDDSVTPTEPSHSVFIFKETGGFVKRQFHGEYMSSIVCCLQRGLSVGAGAGHTCCAVCGFTTTSPRPHGRVCVLAALCAVIIVEITLK